MGVIILNNKLFVMKRQFIFFLILAVLPFATQGQDIEREKSIAVFNHSADIFEKNVLPHLKAFAIAQHPPGKGKEYEDLIDSQYRIFVQKMEFLRKERYDFLFKKEATTKYPADYCEYFGFAYRNHFPGLDYKFFEKVEKECQATD